MKVYRCKCKRCGHAWYFISEPVHRPWWFPPLLWTKVNDPFWQRCPKCGCPNVSFREAPLPRLEGEVVRG